ncbi:MAG: hypothetical protein ABW034_23925 [Steroidobacteraceae bacterium]
MNYGLLPRGPRHPHWLHWSCLNIPALLFFAGCGGGGGGDDAPAPPTARTAPAQFADVTVEGLGFRSGTIEGKTDANGILTFTVGQPVEFFVGEGANRLVLGHATLSASAAGPASISFHDFAEAQGDNDEYLGNLMALLSALDDDADVSDGIRIDAAAHAKAAAAVNGGRTVNLSQPAESFKADPVISSLGDLILDIEEALARFTTLFRQGRSSSIALTRDDRRAVVVNRQKSSVSVIRVRADNGQDASELIAEIPVGKEPRFVALSPDDQRAFVTNAVDGTLSVIDLTASIPAAIGAPVPVGAEPRGIAITPNGTYAFIANHTVGEVTVVRLSTLEVVHSIKTGGNPYAIAITNDGDRNDLDERVFVTRLFSEVIDPKRPDGFDDAKQGIVDTFRVGDAVAGTAQVNQLVLHPMDSGFAADRRPFCVNTRKALQDAGTVKFFNSGADGSKDGASQLAQTTFCPDVSSMDASATGPIGKQPQKVYPNMLFSALVRGPLLYVPNVGAQPEPPVRFNVNVQGLVGVLNRIRGIETDRSLNLNAQVAKETQPDVANETKVLDRVFLNDLVAVDADRRGRNFLFLSRGANYVLKGALKDGKINILDSTNKVTRLQTGNLPSGVVISNDGKRAYTNNELNTSISALDLESNAVLARDIESSTPPAPGTVEHRRLAGKLAFFTALGVPDVLDDDGDGTFDIALRDIDPLQHRSKASDNGWSSCASCHDDGHSDNVTWIFETGPRQTIPLEGTVANNNPDDQRILNWSGVRGSNTDFNNNARGIQGGKGFATNVHGEDRSKLVFNHGPRRGVSDSLDALQEWVEASVRAPIVPEPELSVEAAGRTVFTANCAACHGGDKWTKSSVALYVNNPTFPEDPIGVNFFVGVKPIDTRLTVAGPQIVSLALGSGVLKLLDNVGTFDPANPIEIRGAAAVAGQSTQGFAAFGAAGFNTPSLLGLSLSAPYFHDGSALTLEDVMFRHQLPAAQGQPASTIAQTLSAQDVQNLLSFLRGIDDATPAVK